MRISRPIALMMLSFLMLAVLLSCGFQGNQHVYLTSSDANAFGVDPEQLEGLDVAVVHDVSDALAKLRVQKGSSLWIDSSVVDQLDWSKLREYVEEDLMLVGVNVGLDVMEEKLDYSINVQRSALAKPESEPGRPVCFEIFWSERSRGERYTEAFVLKANSPRDLLENIESRFDSEPKGEISEKEPNTGLLRGFSHPRLHNPPGTAQKLDEEKPIHSHVLQFFASAAVSKDGFVVIRQWNRDCQRWWVTHPKAVSIYGECITDDGPERGRLFCRQKREGGYSEKAFPQVRILVSGEGDAGFVVMKRDKGFEAIPFDAAGQSGKMITGRQAQKKWEKAQPLPQFVEPKVVEEGPNKWSDFPFMLENGRFFLRGYLHDKGSQDQGVVITLWERPR